MFFSTVGPYVPLVTMPTSRPPLVTGGLGIKGTLFAGIVQWRWKMSSNAVHGRWTIDISCGTAGSLRTSFLVR